MSPCESSIAGGRARSEFVRSKKVVAALAAMIAAVAVCLGHASRAEAWVVKDGCNVNPETPEILPALDALGRKVARYRVRFLCGSNRTIYIKQKAYEQDTRKPGDASAADPFASIDNQFASWTWISGFGGSGWKSIDAIYHVPDNLDSDPYVELYHQISFHVVSNGVTGAESVPDKSAVISVHV